jgi:hypothetical protein
VATPFPFLNLFFLIDIPIHRWAALILFQNYPWIYLTNSIIERSFHVENERSEIFILGSRFSASSSSDVPWKVVAVNHKGIREEDVGVEVGNHGPTTPRKTMPALPEGNPWVIFLDPFDDTR